MLKWFESAAKNRKKEKKKEKKQNYIFQWISLNASRIFFSNKEKSLKIFQKYFNPIINLFNGFERESIEPNLDFHLDTVDENENENENENRETHSRVTNHSGWPRDRDVVGACNVPDT